MRPFSFVHLSILLIASLTGSARAGEKTPGENSAVLTLNAATAEALQNNASIRAALSRWSALKARVPQELAWDDAKVSFDTKAARFVEVAPDAFMDQSVGLEQMIPISGKNLVRARIAAAEALAAFEEVRRRQLNVVTEVRSVYFQLANDDAQLDLNHKNLLSLQQASTIVRSGYETGARSATDALMAETEASKLQEAQQDRERSISDDKSHLNVLLNRDAFLPLEISRTERMQPFDLSLPRLRDLMFSQRPEIRNVQAQVDAEQQRVQLAHRAWIPDPAITVQGQRYNDSDQALSEIDTGVSFSIPWGNPKKYSADTQEAKNNLTAKQAELDQVQKESLGLLRDQLQKIETAHHHLALFQGDILSQAQNTLAASQAAYEAGKAGFSDWITAQRLLRDIQSSALDHQTDYEVSIVELEGIIGAELPSSSSPTKSPNKAK